MFPGDLYSSRRMHLYDSFIFNLYLERFYYFLDRDVQIINLFSVKPISTHPLNRIQSFQEEETIQRLKEFLELGEDYKILILPDQFSAYYLLFFSALDLNDEVMTPAPIPYFLKQYTHSLSVRLIHIETSSINDYELPLRGNIEDLITARTKLFYYSEPNFSGGITYSEESLERILFLCRNYHLYIGVDETLSHLIREPENFVQMHNISLENERLIRINSLLKDFSMDDVTVMMFHTALPQRIELIARDLFPVSPYQLASLVYFLDNARDILADRINEMNQKRSIIQNFIDNREDISSFYFRGIGSVFIKLPIPNSESFVEWLLCDYDRDKKTVFVAPSVHFHSDDYEDEGEILIDYRYLNPEMLEEGLEILQDALDQYLGLKKED
ncbi:MAG: aminotransferase class I/II-fold pyridoxal phosphate-dependent enzyme [candidate division WOR-3 bacterium]|nr:aminotransferase class I/II-fold pyridoxal phosphate-dependent enzyme [candidate division WOR-3 bacterium]